MLKLAIAKPDSSPYPILRYRKIPKIGPGAYIFQRPFLRGLFWEGLIFGGAYLLSEICVSKSIGLALQLEVNLLCIWGQFPKYKPPGVLYLEGRFNGGFFALPVWGAYIWRGLYMEGLIFGILRYLLIGNYVFTAAWPLPKRKPFFSRSRWQENRSSGRNKFPAPSGKYCESASDPAKHF